MFIRNKDMYTHQVIIIRPDTTNEFYYYVNDVLNDSFYISLSAQAKTDGKILSEDLVISDDELILERTVVWDSKESFDDFLEQWLIYKPNHKSDFQTYSQSVGHIALFTDNSTP